MFALSVTGRMLTLSASGAARRAKLAAALVPPLATAVLPAAAARARALIAEVGGRAGGRERCRERTDGARSAPGCAPGPNRCAMLDAETGGRTGGSEGEEVGGREGGRGSVNGVKRAPGPVYDFALGSTPVHALWRLLWIRLGGAGFRVREIAITRRFRDAELSGVGGSYGVGVGGSSVGGGSGGSGGGSSSIEMGGSNGIDDVGGGDGGGGGVGGSSVFDYCGAESDAAVVAIATALAPGLLAECLHLPADPNFALLDDDADRVRARRTKSPLEPNRLTLCDCARAGPTSRGPPTSRRRVQYRRSQH